MTSIARSSLSAALVALVSVAVAACSSGGGSSGGDDGCSTDRDCRNGQTCTAGECVEVGSPRGGSNASGGSGGAGSATTNPPASTTTAPPASTGNPPPASTGNPPPASTGNPPPSNDAPKCGGYGSTVAACDGCIQTFCCAEGSACGADPQCGPFADCFANCTTDACLASCETKYPSGYATYAQAFGCTADFCSSECGIPTKGVGDACSTDDQCYSGECGALWCTTSCSENTDCASTSTSNADARGELPWCVPTQGGSNMCFPGCLSAGCGAYPGTTCQEVTAINGATAWVCSL